ncbi:hypothetical protein [Pedobacter deserti]|uniref:hypothetical protein n=1 Tax=Pedobacter deserti TaxID=2817382 RepID=UPI00210BC93A|nr:hypothetical protein [Pedobacter sp. SYSU D00382]
MKPASKILCLLIVTLSACTSEPKEVLRGEYFDLAGYLHKEARQLSSTVRRAKKTVGIDGSYETKELQITDWEEELAPFIDADINKAAWRGKFREVKDTNKVSYVSEDTKIPVKELSVSFENNAINAISIVLKTDNILYSSYDSLRFFPDSLYEIRRVQKINMLGQKVYTVRASLKKSKAE